MEKIQFENIRDESIRERTAKYIRLNNLNGEEFYGLLQKIFDHMIEDNDLEMEHKYDAQGIEIAELKAHLLHQVKENNALDEKIRQAIQILLPKA